ncbi:MAG TPA: response regulator transcription factor [Thermodesulfobacteriota bacterium]|nr:response regulator transcription factor [Thermodesulfobacteriota bacterium]
MSKKLKILIVDEHPFFRIGLKTYLMDRPSYEIIGEASSGEEALRSARSLQPDIALLDISLPDQSGIEVARSLKALMPEIKIMMVSMHSRIDYITESIKAGALGYLVKDSASDRLMEGLETIARGDYFLDSSLSRKVVERLLGPQTQEASVMDQRYASLSSREEQVFRLLAEGHTIKDVAAKLFISPKTVENHRTNIMEKLGLHSSMELIRYAVRIGLVDPDHWKA